MRVVPEKYDGKVTFCQTHLPLWAENAEAIGTSEEAVADLAIKTEAARAALSAQALARNEARAATEAAGQAVAEMAAANAAIILQIRAKAESAGDHVYSLAVIPPPSDPSPIAAPGTPERFQFKLHQVGILSLKWKCKNPRGSSGTMYQVYRRIDSAGPLEFIATTGEKKYLDATIPAGTTTVLYQIRAIRSTMIGQWSSFAIHFGVTGEVPMFRTKAQQAA